MQPKPETRCILLNLPIAPRSNLSRRRFLVGTGTLLAGPGLVTRMLGESASDSTTLATKSCRVHVRLIDAGTRRPTPAMVCISDAASGAVRLPPDGRVCAKPSSVQDFYSGVNFNADPNWVGPVRKMQGKGTNDDRSYVYGDLPSVPYWAEPVLYQTSGDFYIDLPPGRWRVAASHGTEYIPVVRPLEISSQKELECTLSLERWIDLPALGWWSGDVHVHHPSREPAQREFLMHYALAEDVHVVNLLEMGHHQGTDFPQAGFGSTFRVQRGDFALVSGQEDPRSTFGHIIGLNLQKMVRDLATYDFYDVSFRGIHKQQDALVGFAHFSWNGCDLPRGFPWFVTTGEIDFIELLQFRMLNRLEYAEYLNLGFRLTAAAGSDTPWGSTIGEVRTYVHAGKSFNVDSWFQNLKAGRTFVSNGPALEFTVDDEWPGTEMKCAAGQSVRIRARALGHAAIGLPTALRVEGPAGVLKEVTSASGEPELSLQLDHRLEASQWLMASTICQNQAVANTTPVYLVVNGRPTWNPQQGPQIIEKQLNAMSKIETEFAQGQDARSVGVRERLGKARAFYAELRQRMSRSA
jgi:hypothetical protein